MKNMMQYKGFYGSIEYDADDLIFFGKLEFIRSLVSYEGESASDITKAFENAVDDYLAMCEKENLTPEKPFKGSFNIRIGEELHEKATIAASEIDLKLNEFVKNAIFHEIERTQKSLRKTKSFLQTTKDARSFSGKKKHKKARQEERRNSER